MIFIREPGKVALVRPLQITSGSIPAPHAAAAAAALAGGACFREQRGRLGESVTELKQDWNCLGFSDRVKLLLIERFPIAYRGCIRLLQLLGRT